MVVTNADGAYTATLPESGAYSMQLAGDDVFTRSVRATFVEGFNPARHGAGRRSRG